jgi:hypothetical protein
LEYFIIFFVFSHLLLPRFFHIPFPKTTWHNLRQATLRLISPNGVHQVKEMVEFTD